MTQDPNFDLGKAHRYFAATCFNKAWDLIEKPDRTPEEDEQMIRLSQASIWHWTQREDCKSENMSIGYWQASRIHAILGRADDARRYGRLCLEHAPQDSPFLLAYAHEALARAEKAAGDPALAKKHCAEAEALTKKVIDLEERNLLLNDLKTLK